MTFCRHVMFATLDWVFKKNLAAMKKNTLKCYTQELLDLRSEDELIRHITGRANDCYCHVMPLFTKLRHTSKYVTLDCDASVVVATPLLVVDVAVGL